MYKVGMQKLFHIVFIYFLCGFWLHRNNTVTKERYIPGRVREL